MTVDAAKNIEDLAAFVADSPVSYLAARTVARRLQAAGFTELSRDRSMGPVRLQPAVTSSFATARLSPGLAVRRRRRQTATACWVAHTDSPSLKIKPSSSITTKGWHQIAVENYGGALLNSFLDRKLCVAGRLTVR